MTQEDYKALRPQAVAHYGEDYVNGVEIATNLLMAAGHSKWTIVYELESQLDENNERMMAGYNDRFNGIVETLGFTEIEVDRILTYIDRFKKKGLQ